MQGSLPVARAWQCSFPAATPADGPRVGDKSLCRLLGRAAGGDFSRPEVFQSANRREYLNTQSESKTIHSIDRI